jgi:hypothetical protein
MAPMWLASFFEMDKVDRTSREIRWRTVLLKSLDVIGQP